jgi:hypothetical protein
MQNMRTSTRIYEEISNVQNMFQELGQSGFDSRGHKIKLVRRGK